MKEEFTEFICDTCKKKIKVTNPVTMYPYREGWFYLHSLTGRLPLTGAHIEIRDNHLCSYECLLKFIAKEYQENLTNLGFKFDSKGKMKPIPKVTETRGY